MSILEASLVDLESEASAELLQRIFRAAHTLKGSAATIGHRRMAGLTHAMETVLDAVRQGHARPNSGMVDALLAATDALRLLASEVLTGVLAAVDTALLESALAAAMGEQLSLATPPRTAVQPLPGASEEAASAAASAGERGQSVLWLFVNVEESSSLPAIRCYQVLQALDVIATVHQTWPARETIESGGAEAAVTALCSTDASESELIARLSALPDIAAVTSAAFDGAASPPSEERSSHLPVPIRGSHPEAPAAATTASPRHPSQSIRVDVERLDALMNLVGELVIDRARLQRIRQQVDGLPGDARRADISQSFAETTAHLARITDELQDEIMRARMLPIRSVFSRLPRVVRDVAARSGKEVELVISGEATELDRSVVEELADPLVHIIRNAVDHGLEDPATRAANGKPSQGTITLSAWNQETSIYVSIRDDGRGVDTARLRAKAVERGLVSRQAAESATEQEALQYVFLAGLSTAQTLSDVSGRGVGLDIVRTNVERLQGSVSVTTVAGVGSEFVIQLPLTLATTRALLVNAAETTYAIPMVSVIEALTRSQAGWHSIARHPTIRLRERLVPVITLAAAVGNTATASTAEPYIVVVRHGSSLLALAVDELIGEHEVVVKSLGPVVGSCKGLLGATVLGDGTLGLIVDCPSLIAKHALQLAAAAS